MNLKEVKKYVGDTIENYFKPKVLKKFDEDTNGNLTFDGDPISAKVSEKLDNAIKVISDTTTPTNDGLYVEDLSSEIDKLNIAQKTVNEDMDYIQLSTSNQQVSLSPGDVIKFQNARVVHNMEFDTTTGYIKLEAHKSYCLRARLGIYSYSYIAYQFKDMTNNVKIGTAGLNMYKNNRDASDDTGSFAVAYITPSTDIDVALVVHDGTGTFDIQYTSSLEAYEIGRVVTIDPMNYIDTKQGIQDTPVGELITKIGSKVPAHYLLCDGTEYNITDYPYLAQAIKDEFGTFNYYGGDGTTTFAVPNKPSGKFIKRLNPIMTSNTAPAGSILYSPSTAGKNSVYYAFKEQSYPGEGECWVCPGNSGYLGYEFVSHTTVNAYRLQPRLYMDSNTLISTPNSWDFQASNDLSTWDTLDSQTGITWSNTDEKKTFFFKNETPYKAYRILVKTNNGSNYVIIGNLQLGTTEVENSLFIKYEPTYFVGSINGHEEVTELLSTPILIQSSANTGKQLNGLQYNLLKEIDTFDKIEIILEYAGDDSTASYRAQTNIFRVQDIVYSDDNSHTSGNSENINCNFMANGSIAGASVMFNWCTNKKSIKLTDIWATGFNQNIYYRIKSIRGIRSIYAPDKALGSGTGSK